MEKVIVRYGPSPTGIPHIGNIRTALFNYLIAKKTNGKFYLRIEDTDQNRIVKGAVEKIRESLNLLGISWDDEVVFQSKRLDIYNKHLDILIEKGFAYEEDGAFRFKINTKKAIESWDDVVHGKIEYPTKVLEDFVILKSDGFPTYHFASVVDDHLMEITHVLRGDEWIPSTPKHLQLYEAFGWHCPKFVHLPVILGPDKKKLSKRDGAKTVHEFIEEGYLPEALVNFMALLGWAPKTNREIFSMEELTNEFSLERINKNSPVFNVEKLNWFNGQWIRKMEDKKLCDEIISRNKNLDKYTVLKVIPLIKDRINKISDFDTIAGLFFKKPDLSKNLNEIKIDKNTFQNLLINLKNVEWKENAISQSVESFMKKEKLTKPQLYRSIGIAISGELITPPVFASMEILGKEETIKRLENAAAKI